MLQHCPRLLRLGLEGHLRRHFGFGPPRSVQAPLLRQKQLAVEKDVSAGGGIGQQRGDLAVLDLAQRTTILLVHAHRTGALLGNAGFIQDRNAHWIAKALHHELL